MNKTHIQTSICHILRRSCHSGMYKGFNGLREKKAVADKSYRTVQWNLASTEKGR